MSVLGALLLGVIALPAPPASAAPGDPLTIVDTYLTSQKYGTTQTLTTQDGTGDPVTFSVTSGPCTVGLTSGVVTLTSGTGTCVVSATDGTNSDTADIDATKRTLVETADNVTLKYGAPAPVSYTATASGDGLVYGDTFSLLDPLSCTSAYAPGDLVGTQDILCTGTIDTDKYDLTLTKGTLTVNKADIVVTGDDKNVTYGALPPPYTYNLDDGDSFYGTEDFSSYPVCSSTYTQGQPADDYAITCTGGAVDTTKYTLVENPGTLTVGARALQVKADPQTAVYGGTAPPFTYQATGFYGTEDFTDDPVCESTYVQGDPVGTYPITCSGATVTPADNYDITYVAGKLTVGALGLGAGGVAYSGPLSFQAKNKTDTSITLPLEATVDLTVIPGYGDHPEWYNVEDALVTFIDEGSGKVLAKNVAVSANDTEPALGVAVTWVTLPIGPTGATTYSIKAVLAGSYSGDSSVETLALGLPATTAGTISGIGLHVPDVGTPAGKYFTDAAYAGTDMTFYFEAGATKKSSTPKGQLIASWDGPSGTTYWLKSNAITAVTVSNGTTATVTFKASIWQVADDGYTVIPGTSDGNVVGRVDLNDVANTVGLTTQSSKTSALYLSTNWVKSGRTYYTSPVTLTAGIGLPLVVN